MSLRGAISGCSRNATETLVPHLWHRCMAVYEPTSLPTRMRNQQIRLIFPCALVPNL